MFEIGWQSEDRQGFIPMGEYVSLNAARRETGNEICQR